MAAPLSALDPAGPAAAEIAAIWWVMLVAGLAILGGMTVLALYVGLRATGNRPLRRPLRLVAAGGLAFPAVVLAALLAYGARTGQSLLPLPTDEEVYRVEVTGHRWWWEVQYPGAPGGPLYGANEIHVPAGRPVDVVVRSADVIHSFWVPRLGGKIDAIPGHTNVLRLTADAPGVYRGQCSEFCGAQHTNMGLRLIAHPPEELDAALDEHVAGTLAEESDAVAELFANECSACHSTDAAMRAPNAGPNLAGVARRAALGAETIANDAEALRLWIDRHHVLKPGNLMPSHRLGGEEVDALANYLERRQ